MLFFTTLPAELMLSTALAEFMGIELEISSMFP
jgi:hypothetical protein